MTVPLDLLVRVRDTLESIEWAPDHGLCHLCHATPKEGHDPACEVKRSLTELAAQIEQQREGQGEPVAWRTRAIFRTDPTKRGEWKYWDSSQRPEVRSVLDCKFEPLFATPQDSVPAWAIKVLSDAFAADPSYAWTWHCNVAMAAVDAGAPHGNANERAADFMRHAFGFDTRQCKEYQP